MKRSTKIVLFLVLAGFVATASSVRAQKYVGTWTGTATQPGADPFSITMTLREGGGKIDFPSLGCGGSLALLQQSNDQYVFAEDLEYGRDKCVVGLNVRITFTSADYNSLYWEEIQEGKVVGYATLRLSDDSAFRIQILREYSDRKCTSGYLAVNGEIIAYTLERPWQNNQQNISSIPNGTYRGILRYDHRDHWRIELVNVPGRSNIQIHIGNQPDQTQGCILVGQQLGRDLCSLIGSAAAYQRLKAAFYGSENPVSTPDKRISVTITGQSLR